MIARKSAVLVVVTLCCVWPGSARAAPIVGDDNVKLKVLDNGLRIVVKEENTWPIVAMGMFVRAGSLHETDQQVGVAHLVEHLLFEAESPEGESDVAEYIESIGGRMSAYTLRDFTHVDITVASKFVEPALASLIKTVFDAQFDEQAILHEQAVIAREIADMEEGLAGAMDFKLWDMAFESHPYGRPVGGTAKEVRSITVETARAFYNNFYVPNNMSLVVVGRVDTDWLFDRVAKLTADHRAGNVEWTEPAREQTQDEVRKHIATRDSQMTAISYAWHAPGMPDETDICATDLIYILLGKKQVGRLDKLLVEEKNYAADVRIDYLTQKHPGLFVITAVVMDKNEMAVRKAILEQAQRLVDEPVPEDELARAKLLLRTEYAFSNETYAGQVGSLGFYDAITSYRFAIDYIDIVSAITPEQLQAAARKLFVPDSYSIVILRREQDAPAVEEVKLLCPAAES
jgi:zinc protease